MRGTIIQTCAYWNIQLGNCSETRRQILLLIKFECNQFSLYQLVIQPYKYFNVNRDSSSEVSMSLNNFYIRSRLKALRCFHLAKFFVPCGTYLRQFKNVFGVVQAISTFQCLYKMVSFSTYKRTVISLSGGEYNRMKVKKKWSPHFISSYFICQKYQREHQQYCIFMPAPGNNVSSF